MHGIRHKTGVPLTGHGLKTASILRAWRMKHLLQLEIAWASFQQVSQFVFKIRKILGELSHMGALFCAPDR
jgi:hypothetical protein